MIWIRSLFTTVYLILLICNIVHTMPTNDKPDKGNKDVVEIEEVLSALKNLTQSQLTVWSQQVQFEQEVKKRNEVEDSRETARSQALEDQQHTLKEITGKVSRKLKDLSKVTSITDSKGKIGFKDCAATYLDGEDTSGTYRVWPNNNVDQSFLVYCDMDTAGGGWTVIQRQGIGGYPQDYFQRTWIDYKNGFGNPAEDFWIGNDLIRTLTNQGAYSIRFDFGDRKDKLFAVYNSFWIEDESRGYQLHIGRYDSSGTAGDVFTSHNGARFSTLDRNNAQQDCITIQGRFRHVRGWWFTIDCNLNARLKLITTEQTNSSTFQGTEIKIRPIRFQKMKEEM